MDIKKEIGQRIRGLRLSQGLSQERLALETGIDRTYIASVEAGKRNISIEKLQEFWIFFKISPSEFFSDQYFGGGAIN